MWTPAQYEWLKGHYAKAGYLPPVGMVADAEGEALIDALVHEDGRPNQPRDPHSESMVRTFGLPCRRLFYAERRTLEEIFQQVAASIRAGDPPPFLSKAMINHLTRESIRLYGSATGWKAKWFKMVEEAKAAR